MLTLRPPRAFLLSFAALSVAAAATTPAAATTISITPQIWDYFDPTFSNNYHLNTLGPNQTHTASVGEIRPTIFQSANGDYAATLEFAIPALPSNAVLSDITLTVTAFLGDRLGDVQLRTYVAADTAGDPSRLYAGSLITNSYHPSRSGTTTDLFTTNAAPYFEDNAGFYLGFSIRETNTHCRSFSCETYDILGSSSVPASYALPVLSVTYDVPTLPPPPTTVPEPASLALLGMGVVGVAAVRRRRAG